MTIGKRIQFREVLREARAQSMLALAATNAGIEAKERRRAADSLSEGLQIEQQNDQLIADHESATLIAINGLLEVLNDEPGLYGMCQKCGRPISLARLQFSPWSSRCEKHAEEQIQ